MSCQFWKLICKRVELVMSYLSSQWVYLGAPESPFYPVDPVAPLSATEALEEREALQISQRPRSYIFLKTDDRPLLVSLLKSKVSI